MESQILQGGFNIDEVLNDIHFMASSLKNLELNYLRKVYEGMGKLRLESIFRAKNLQSLKAEEQIFSFGYFDGSIESLPSSFNFFIGQGS